MPQDTSDPKVQQYYHQQRLRDEGSAASGDVGAQMELNRIFDKLQGAGRVTPQQVGMERTLSMTPGHGAPAQPQAGGGQGPQEAREAMAFAAMGPMAAQLGLNRNTAAGPAGPFVTAGQDTAATLAETMIGGGMASGLAKGAVGGIRGAIGSLLKRVVGSHGAQEAKGVADAVTKEIGDLADDLRGARPPKGASQGPAPGTVKPPATQADRLGRQVEQHEGQQRADRVANQPRVAVNKKGEAEVKPTTPKSAAQATSRAARTPTVKSTTKVTTSRGETATAKNTAASRKAAAREAFKKEHGHYPGENRAPGLRESDQKAAAKASEGGRAPNKGRPKAKSETSPAPKAEPTTKPAGDTVKDKNLARLNDLAKKPAMPNTVYEAVKKAHGNSYANDMFDGWKKMSVEQRTTAMKNLAKKLKKSE